MTTASTRPVPIFPAPELDPGVLNVILASTAQPVDFRRVEGFLQTWMSQCTVEAVKAWALDPARGTTEPRRHRLQIAPPARATLQVAMDADRMVLATITSRPFRADIPGWPVTWVEVTSHEDLESQVRRGKVQGVVVEVGVDGTPDEAFLSRLTDRVPVLRVDLGAPQPRGVVPCGLSVEAPGIQPMEEVLPAVEAWLFRAGQAALEASLSRRSLRFELACTHRWEAASHTLVTEIAIASEEKVLKVALSKDATPFAEIPDLGFKDVIGMTREKRALWKAVQAHVAWRPGEPLPPKGYLLTGPPGTGKTFLARALAGEAQLPILALAAADLQTMWYGETERKIREVFATARAHRPAIIFLDEIDALAMRRDAARSSNPEVQASIVTTLLDCLDGFSKGSVPVLVLAATNHPEVLDPAFCRAGRFDRAISIDLPAADDREAFLRANLAEDAMEEVGLKEAVRLSSGLSFADLAQLLKDLREDENSEGGSEVHDLREGLLRRMLGEAPKEGTYDASTRHATAVHEAGHAVVWTALFGQPPDYLSIRPRGRTLGVTVNTTTEASRVTTSWVKTRIATMLAGRAAETLFLPDASPSAGAADDLAKATDLALKAIGTWGLEPEFGLASMDALPETVRMALTPALTHHLNAWLTEGNAKAVETLTARSAEVEALVEALLKEGDLDEAMLQAVLIRS
ncbi:MAG: AAA family ATPase [Nitrospira sp.]|nr:AAA family ATPase [Nitrospira sp.]